MVPTLTAPVMEPHITKLLTPQFVRLLVYTVGSGLAVVTASGGNANAGADSLEDGPPSDVLHLHLSVPLILSGHSLTLAENAYSTGGTVCPRSVER